MRTLLFVLALLVAIAMETSAYAGLYLGLILALLINFLFSRTKGYLFLVSHAFLVASLRLDPAIGLIVLGDLVLLKFTELVTFHFSRSRDSALRFLLGLLIILLGHQLLLYPQFWQHWQLISQLILLNIIVAFAIFSLVKLFYRWLSPQQFEVLAK